MAATIKILAADSVSLAGSEILPRDKYIITSKPGISNSEIVKYHYHYDVLLTRSTRKIDSDLLEKCSFRIVATFTKGIDHIDAEAARRCNVKIINAETGNDVSAAEHTIALILYIVKGLKQSEVRIKKGQFADTDFLRSELFGKTAGIIGFGKVGSRVGMLCRSFGMEVLANDTDPQVALRHKETTFLQLNSLLKKSDIVSLHIPFDPFNEEFFGEKCFGAMKKDAIFINTSRGAVVNEESLIQTLQGKRIRAAGIDVFLNEPEIDKRFLKLKNAVLTNHTAGKTVESRDRISRLMFEKIFTECSK